MHTNCALRIQHRNRKQNENRWGLQDCGHHLQNKHIDNRENRWGLQNSQDFQFTA